MLVRCNVALWWMVSIFPRVFFEIPMMCVPTSFKLDVLTIVLNGFMKKVLSGTYVKTL